MKEDEAVRAFWKRVPSLQADGIVRPLISATKQLLLLALSTVVCISNAAGQSDDGREEHGNLTIHLSDTSGDKQLGGVIRVYSKKEVLVYSAATASEVTVRLPYGQYVIGFTSEFLRPVRREVEVDQPEVFVMLATSMGPVVLDIPIDLVSVSIRVAPSDSCSPVGFLWAKLVGVFSNYSKERRMSKGGFALFEPVDGGTYVVLIVDGNRVRMTQEIVTKGPVTVVNLSLPTCAPQND